MNWEVRYRLFRPTPLTDIERDGLLEHVRRTRDGSLHDFDINIPKEARPDALIAAHAIDMYYSDAHDSDVPKLLQALTTLRELIPDATMEVWDSYELVAWNPGTEKYDTMGMNDYQKFDLPAVDDTFLGLGRLDYDHRFTSTKVTHTASRVEPAAPEKDVTSPLVVTGEPVFVAEERYRETRLSLATWVKCLGPVPVTVERVESVLRDGGGHPLDCEWDVLDLRVKDEARLVVDVPGPQSIHGIAQSVSLTAQVQETFEHTLGDWTVDRQTAPPEMRLVATAGPSPASWPVRVSLGGFINPDQADRSWRIVVEVQALSPSYKAIGDLVLDFLDSQGRTLTTERSLLAVTTDASRFATSVWHSAHEMDAVSRITLRGQFEVTRHVSLGSWALPRSTK